MYQVFHVASPALVSLRHSAALRVDYLTELRRRVHPLTVQTLLLYSHVGLDPKLAKRALEDSLK